MIKLEDIETGMLVTTNLNEIGVIHSICNYSENNCVKVKITKTSIFHKKGEICEYTLSDLTKRKTSILVRPDDFALFIENEDGSFSHEHNHSNNRYDKILLQSLGFITLESDDTSGISDVREQQKLYAQYLLWYNRSDGHGGIKGGTLEEFKNNYINQYYNDSNYSN